MEPKANELSKDLALGKDENIHIRITPLDDVGSPSESSTDCNIFIYLIFCLHIFRRCIEVHVGTVGGWSTIIILIFFFGELVITITRPKPSTIIILLFKKN